MAHHAPTAPTPADDVILHQVIVAHHAATARARVDDVFAVVDTEWNQTASEPTTAIKRKNRLQ